MTIDPFRGVPMALAEAAVTAKTRADREARRGRGDAWDEIWCVFDRDEHPRIDEALSLAAEHRISVAMSNPCLELWFLLHTTDQRAYLSRHEAQRAVRHRLGFDKAPSPDDLAALRDQYETAKRSAITLDAKHAADGSPPGENPSSSIWRLVDALRTAGEQAG